MSTGIKPEDLRHGAKFYFNGISEGLFLMKNEVGTLRLNDNKKFYVEFRTISNELLEVFKEDEISPIPLTEEVLVEWCGFIEEDIFQGDVFNYTKDGITIQWMKYWVGQDPSYCWIDFGTKKEAYIDLTYLHELQNLWYATRKTELTINIPKNK